MTWTVRPARPHEAAEACAVIRRSIEELCHLDHDDDPAVLGPWLANKMPERVRSWIDGNPTGTLVGVDPEGIAGVGCIMPDGVIGLLYVAPWKQRRGVGRALLRHMEHVASDADLVACTVRNTATARDFYLASGYVADGKPVASFGGKPAYPMRRTL